MQEQKNRETKKKYKVGVAFSGGGARGFAHVGALKALEEALKRLQKLAELLPGKSTSC